MYHCSPSSHPGSSSGPPQRSISEPTFSPSLPPTRVHFKDSIGPHNKTTRTCSCYTSYVQPVAVVLLCKCPFSLLVYGGPLQFLFQVLLFTSALLITYQPPYLYFYCMQSDTFCHEFPLHAASTTFLHRQSSRISPPTTASKTTNISPKHFNFTYSLKKILMLSKALYGLHRLYQFLLSLLHNLPVSAG